MSKQYLGLPDNCQCVYKNWLHNEPTHKEVTITHWLLQKINWTIKVVSSVLYYSIFCNHIECIIHVYTLYVCVLLFTTSYCRDCTVTTVCSSDRCVYYEGNTEIFGVLSIRWWGVHKGSALPHQRKCATMHSDINFSIFRCEGWETRNEINTFEWTCYHVLIIVISEYRISVWLLMQKPTMSMIIVTKAACYIIYRSPHFGDERKPLLTSFIQNNRLVSWLNSDRKWNITVQL